METNFEHVNKNFTANFGMRYGIDTKQAPVTCTLPTTVSVGFSIFFADWSGSFSENIFTVKTTGSQTINGTATTLVLDTSGDSIGLFWTGTTWRTYE